MKTFFIILICAITTLQTAAQNDTIYKEYKNASDLNTQLKDAEIVSLIHVDSTFAYKAAVPQWLTLIETNNPKIWGGTLPAIGYLEDTIIVQGFAKSQFDSFDHFTEIFITGNKFGQPTLYNKNVKWYGRNERDFRKVELGLSSRVFTFSENKIYHHQFTLIETATAYLWVQLISTPEIYDMNIDKFNSFIETIELLPAED